MLEKRNVLSFCALLVFAGILLACNSHSEAVGKLKNEVMAIHDEAMPPWFKIQDKQRSLTKLTEKILEANPNDSQATFQKISELQTRLGDAHLMMQNWMQNFDSDMTDMTEEEQIAYLTQEKATMAKCAQAIKSSLAETDALLKANNFE